MMMIEYITRTLRVNSRSKIVVLTYNLVRTPTLLVLHSWTWQWALIFQQMGRVIFGQKTISNKSAGIFNCRNLFFPVLFYRSTKYSGTRWSMEIMGVYWNTSMKKSYDIYFSEISIHYNSRKYANFHSYYWENFRNKSKYMIHFLH